jgi:hypothetical protein
MLWKTKLLEAIANQNRGIFTTPDDQKAILALISQLENFNPHPRPFTVPQLLDGNWRLLYTSSEELLGIDKFPFLNLGEIYQCIRVEEGKIYNIAEVQSLPLLAGIVSVVAKFKIVTDQRVNVQFQRAITGLQKLIAYQSPDSFINEIQSGKKFTALDFVIKNNERQGWLDITYLDEDMRIGRGNVGSVFVLTKS